MSKLAVFAARIGDLILDAINRSNKKKMSDDAANSIANNDDGVRKSEQSFSDMASKSRGDSTK